MKNAIFWASISCTVKYIVNLTDCGKYGVKSEEVALDCSWSLCLVELVVQFPARGSTQVLLCLFPGVFWLWHFLCSVVHIQCQTSIYTLSMCRRHSWRVRLAKQETLTPHSSPLVCGGPRISTLVLYCWCHSDDASVRLYFTLKVGCSVIIFMIITPPTSFSQSHRRYPSRDGKVWARSIPNVKNMWL